MSSRRNSAVGALPIATTAPSSRSRHSSSAAALRVVPSRAASVGHPRVAQGADDVVARGQPRAGDAGGDHLRRRRGSARRPAAPSRAAATTPGEKPRSSTRSTCPQAWIIRTATWATSGGSAGEVGLGADGGERAAVDLGAVADVAAGHGASPGRYAVDEVPAPGERDGVDVRGRGARRSGVRSPTRARGRREAGPTRGRAGVGPDVGEGLGAARPPGAGADVSGTATRGRRRARRRPAPRRAAAGVGQHDGAPRRDDDRAARRRRAARTWAGGQLAEQRRDDEREPAVVAATGPEPAAVRSGRPPSARGVRNVASWHAAARDRPAPQPARDPRRRVGQLRAPATPSRRPPRAARGTPRPRRAAPSTAVGRGTRSPVSTPATSSRSRRLPAQVRVLAPRRRRARRRARTGTGPAARPAPAARTARGPASAARTSVIRRVQRGSTVDVRRRSTRPTVHPCDRITRDPRERRRQHVAHPLVRRRRQQPGVGQPARPAAARRGDRPRSCRFPREVRCTRAVAESSAQPATTRSAAASIAPPGSRTRASAPSAASCRREHPGAGVGAERTRHRATVSTTAAQPAPLTSERSQRLDAAVGRADRCDSGRVSRQLHTASGGQEAGANPARSRHCHRGADPADGHGRTPGRPGRAPIREPGHCPARRAPASPGRGSRGRSAMRRAPPERPVILLLSTSDTDLLSRPRQRRELPARPTRPGSPPATCPRCSTAPTSSWSGSSAATAPGRTGIDARARAAALPVVVLGGEQAPGRRADGAVHGAGGRRREAHTYLAQGGPDNLRQLHAFLSDTVLLTGEGFAPPRRAAELGRPRPRRDATRDGPTVAVLYYRAQQLAGNTAFVEALCARDRGRRRRAPLPVFCASLRTAEPELLRHAAARPTRWSSPCSPRAAPSPPTRRAGGDDEAWDVARAGRAGRPDPAGPLPDQQPRAAGRPTTTGCRPLDVATQVAVPEFDGRHHHGSVLVQGDRRRRADRLRRRPRARARVAGHRGAARPAARTSRPRDKRVALVLSAYPTKHARIGNAVGLDTPASAVALLRAMREAGYDIGDIPGVDARGRRRADPRADRAPAARTRTGSPRSSWPGNPSGSPPRDYRDWFATLPADLRDARRASTGARRRASCSSTAAATRRRDRPRRAAVGQRRADGPAAARLRREPGRDLPRPGPAAVPPLPGRLPLAATTSFGADAIVHLGKHGNLEWLPGKTLGMSAACGTDAALGDLPLIYPFLVNDPGEGTQAKRRAHATLVDHLIPPMARAETYGDIARLEQLLDEHANIAALDPAKLPAIRQQIWTLMQAAKLDHDLGLDERPDDDGVRRLRAARRRLAVRDQGRPDPRRPARPRRRARPARRGSTWCWRSCAPARCGAASDAVPGLRAGARPGRGRQRRPRRRRRRRGAGPRTRRRAAGRRLGRRRRSPTAAPTNADGRARSCEFAATEVVPRLAGTDRRDRRRSCTRSTAGSSPAGPVGLAAARAGQRAADRPQLLLRRPEGRAVAAGLGDRSGDGRFAARTATSPTHGELPALGRAVGVGHLGDAHLRRRHRRGARAARASGRCGTRRPAASSTSRSIAARRARPAAHRRHRAHLRLLPRRVPARASRMLDDAVQLGRRPRRARRATTTCAPTRRPTSPSTATSAAPPPGSSAPSRAPTAPGCCS